MIRMRVILFSLVLVISYGIYVAVTHESHRLIVQFVQLLALLVEPILLLAAMTILLFSFVRVGVTADGQLCYNPKNPYWRLMNWYYEENWGNSVYLCKAYWFTAWIITLGVFILAVCAFLVMAVVCVVKNPLDVLNVLNVLKFVGIVIAIVAGGLAISAGCSKLTEIFPWLKYIWITLGVLVLAALIVAVPIMIIMGEKDLSLLAALKIYGMCAGGIVGGIAVIILLVRGAFKYLPLLPDTLLGHMFKAAKEPFCPQLIACPIAGRGNTLTQLK